MRMESNTPRVAKTTGGGMYTDVGSGRRMEPVATIWPEAE